MVGVGTQTQRLLAQTQMKEKTRYRRSIRVHTAEARGGRTRGGEASTVAPFFIALMLDGHAASDSLLLDLKLSSTIKGGNILVVIRIK